VHYSIIMYDDGLFNQFWMPPPTCMTYMECKNDLWYCAFTIWPSGNGHHTTPWMLYIKIILSFVSSECIQILCFCDECVQCHSEDCNFSFSSYVLDHAASIEITWFSVLSSLRHNCFRTMYVLWGAHCCTSFTLQMMQHPLGSNLAHF